MESFERGCLFGRSFRNPSAGSSCGTSNHWAGLLRRPSLPLRNLDGRILIRSLGCLVQNHRQTHASFRQACFHGLGGVGLISLADGKTLLEHSPSHVIVFGAALQFHVRFDADFFREAIVDGGFRSLVALPGPVVHMDAGSFPGGALRAKLFVQFVGVSKRVGDFHVAFHNLRVPDLMKVGRIILTFRMERIEKRFRESADLSFRMARCSSMARVTHPSVPQYPSSSPLYFPRGISM